MRKAKVYTACRDCKRCTNSPIADAGRSFGRGTLAMTTFGVSELVFAVNKKCRMCGHQMSLHDDARGALPVEVVGPVETVQPPSAPLTPLPGDGMANDRSDYTDDGWPMMEPLPKRESSLLANTLVPGETVLGQLVGQFHQSVIATSNRLIIAKSGIVTNSGFRGKAISIDYRNVTAIAIRSTLMGGLFQIAGGGMTIPDARAGSDRSARLIDLPNVVPFFRADREKWGVFVGKLREMTSRRHDAINNEVAKSSSSSISELLTELAQLHEAGILSDAEFAKKKAELLSRM